MPHSTARMSSTNDPASHHDDDLSERNTDPVSDGGPGARNGTRAKPGPLGPAVPTGDYRSKVTSSSAVLRRHCPERPPVFSHKASSPTLISRSTDLHMS